MSKLLMIDNYDSFTWNLVQYFGELGQTVQVVRNDEMSLEQLAAQQPARLVISPGPCTPAQAGVSVEAIRFFADKNLPILGVCLGHQSVGVAFGGKVVAAKTLMHGKTSAVEHDGKGLFQDLPAPLTCTRYHSLALERASLPECLTISAWTADNEIMALRHQSLPVVGVQFHPESFLSAHGHDLLRNFLNLANGTQ